MPTHHPPTAARTGATLQDSRRMSACAAASASQDEPLAGTAGNSNAWLLVEHPGPWPESPVEQALGSDLVAELRHRAPGLRVVLIRRPGERTVGHPRCVMAWTSTDPHAQPWMRDVQLDGYEDLARLDVESLVAGRRVAVGIERQRPLYAVCTHGKRDACCAEFGRPVVRALQSEHADVWECTHVGGDRFAANLVCFPHGIYYGRLNPVSALAAANDYRDGRIRLANLRGRSGQHPAAQAAEYFVRVHEQLTALDAVYAHQPAATGDETDIDVRVTVTTGHGADATERHVDVRLSRIPSAAPLSPACRDTEPTQFFTWALRDLIELSPARL